MKYSRKNSCISTDIFVEKVAKDDLVKLLSFGLGQEFVSFIDGDVGSGRAWVAVDTSRDSGEGDALAVILNS
jgi:hypothetical protein